ncbi:PucR family transcriptional regulator [Paenibacillus sp. GCM10023252]|uniref:PucR family transcriptional regulator n=1 Tax=Paenibacillus sp. GCM10023252 TaxID=3252649 RepID=UPI003606B72D
MTVEQALAVYPLSEGKLVAGGAGLQRIVRAVNVMETPDLSRWVREGEMLFMTSYMLQECDGDVRLLRKLNEQGSAGLGVKPGPEWDAISASITEEADRLSFPLIELPARFTFSDQVGGLFRAEMQGHMQAAQTVLDKQKKLMRFALRREPAQERFASLSTILNLPIAVVNGHGRLVFNSTMVDEAKLLKQWPWPKRERWMTIAGVSLCRISLVLGEERIGHVLYRVSGPLAKMEESLLHQASEIISHHLEDWSRPSYGLPAQDDLGTLFLRYLQGNATVRALMDRARRIGVMLCNGEYYCILSTHSHTGVSGKGAGSSGVDRYLSEAMMTHPRLTGLQIVHFTVEEGSLFVIPAEKFHNVEGVSAVLKECIAALDKRGGMPLLRMAVSHKKSGPSDLREAYSECVDTARLGAVLAPEARVIPFVEMELAYLFEGVPRERMARFCRLMFRKLDEEESEGDRELMRTLEVFLEQDAQVGEAAKHLYIHRNTAAYRLEKISEMLEVDFKRTMDLLRLKLAFLFRKVVREDAVVDYSNRGK